MAELLKDNRKATNAQNNSSVQQSVPKNPSTFEVDTLDIS